jgi:transcriptional regulatory protein RtcR
MSKPTVVIGLLGPVLDAGDGPRRWERWRPTISICQHDDLVVKRLELLHQRKFTKLAAALTRDIGDVSPETEVVPRHLEFNDAWDFEQVFAALHDFARTYPFDPDREDYLVHITTGTHVAQICLFLLAESRHFPARLLQTSPPLQRDGGPARYEVIDLDLSRFDRLAARFERERTEAASILKSGIPTRNAGFNRLIERIERVVVRSRAPVLLTGPTGAGKSLLAQRIYELKKARRQVTGEFVEVNCATLRGDGAMSTLFGHVKGAFTGALKDRPGLLRRAHGGVLFLDEIGELGLDEQAMLLRALEQKTFLPLGADEETSSDFQLLAGTNRELSVRVAEGRFREDLLARIDLWTFPLPPLRARPEDVEPNLDYELELHERRTGTRVTLNREARAAFVGFATGPEGLWPRNFRDLSGAITRMCTLAGGGRVTARVVEDEVARLRRAWRTVDGPAATDLTTSALGTSRAGQLDLFDRLQLDAVLQAIQGCRTLSEAGRRLFAVSRGSRPHPNDADRVRKYLARHGLTWDDVRRLAATAGPSAQELLQ